MIVETSDGATPLCDGTPQEGQTFQHWSEEKFRQHKARLILQIQQWAESHARSGAKEGGCDD